MGIVIRYPLMVKRYTLVAFLRMANYSHGKRR